jgi:iron complex outermembrane receptor protein
MKQKSLNRASTTLTESSRHTDFAALAAALVLLLALTDRAPAAEPPSGQPAVNQLATEQPALQQVVVTATRRATTVQATPISITAVTGAQMASRGIVDSDSLASSVPGIAVRNTGGPGEEEFEIRGLNSQGGGSSMVGMYLGDIPLSTAMGSQLGKNLMNVGLYDVERVEVLRGPQGTLYGSSSMGGTMRVLPNGPQLNTYAASTEDALSGTASGGGINHQENGMVNIPLGNSAAVRVVGSFTSDSGWIKRLVLADGVVPVDSGVFPNLSRPDNFYTAPLQESLSGVNTTVIDSARVELLWKPTESFSIEPVAMYQLVQQAGPPTVDVNGDPTHPTTPIVLAHYEIYDTPEPQTDSLSFGSLTMVYQFPSFSATSATGFWHRNFLDLQDCTEMGAGAIGIPVYDAAAGGLGTCESDKGMGTLEQDYSRQLSDEFRLTSTAPGPVQWVAGYFYQDLYSEDAISSLEPEATPILGGPNGFVGSLPEVMVQNAFYGHVSWRLSPHFEAAAGFRRYHYSLDERSTEVGVFSALGPEGNDVPYDAGATIAASGTVPSVTLTFNIDRDNMAYVRIDKGFRLGGASGTAGPIPVVAAGNTNPLYSSEVANECGLQAKVLLTSTCNPNILLQGPTTYGSDSLWSYELGEKSSFFRHRLIVNLDGYLEDWYQPQVPTNIAGFGFTVNGGNARIKGVEGQLETLLPGGFDLSLNASYTSARFVESSALAGYAAGTQIPDTPMVSGSAVLQWEDDLASGLALFGTLEEDYTGARTDLPFGVTATLQTMNQLLVHMPAYSIANFRLGVKGERDEGGRWSASLFVDNITNNQVLLDPQPQISLQDTAYARYVVSQPLTAGIDISYAFR